MELKKYMEWTQTTAIYPPAHAVPYLALGLVGEAGEVANVIKKALRDDAGTISLDRRRALICELGDVLWYWARLCDELDLDPQNVLEANIDKLNDRKIREVIGGSGDDR